jgi:hypothetical protein
MLFFRLLTLCCARASELVTLLSDNPCETVTKWDTCPILKRGRILDVRLAGECGTKTASDSC